MTGKHAHQPQLDLNGWNDPRMVMPEGRVEVELAYTIPGCGNGLYRGYGMWCQYYWHFEDETPGEPKRAVRYWRPATPLPNNGLYPGPLDD